MRTGKLRREYTQEDDSLLGECQDDDIEYRLRPGTTNQLEARTPERPTWQAVLPVSLGKRKRWPAKYVTGFQPHLLAIAVLPTLPAVQYRVLFAVLGLLEWDNWVGLSQTKLAKTIGMHPRVVSKALAGLESRGFLERGAAQLGQGYAYRLRRHIAWKGTVTAWWKHHREAEARQQAMADRVMPEMWSRSQGSQEEAGH